MEKLLIKSNGQWLLKSDDSEKKEVTDHGDYTLHTKSAGYQDSDTGGEDAEPRDVYDHDVYHKGKHIGSVASVKDADGRHQPIGVEVPPEHEDYIVDKALHAVGFKGIMDGVMDGVRGNKKKEDLN